MVYEYLFGTAAHQCSEANAPYARALLSCSALIPSPWCSLRVPQTSSCLLTYLPSFPVLSCSITMVLLNMICRAAMRFFCGHLCISCLLQICSVSLMIVAFTFMTFILSYSSVLLIKGPTAPCTGVLTLPNTWATKLSFTKRSSVKVCY